jgi:hypothetical protein
MAVWFYLQYFLNISANWLQMVGNPLRKVVRGDGMNFGTKVACDCPNASN